MEQNFTQFCTANGYPSDYDMMFEAQYNGGLGLAGRISKRTIKAVEIRADENRALHSKAHSEYTEAILSGEIVDPNGEVVKEKILAYRQKATDDAIESKRMTIQSSIDFIETLGRMSHRTNGKLKPTYQRTVDHYQQELTAL